MNDLSETLARLLDRIETLERRVSTLEQNRRTWPLASSPAQQVTATTETKTLLQEAGAFSILGKAMLAVAGAYLLRALTESSALPRIPVVALAIAYAFLWLIPAARAKTWLPSVAWAVTSAIILVPMLWELTLRFAFLPDAVAAGVLALFAIAASALA